ncbi:tyrosinase MelC2 [Krasilnikovia sp. MM14-A1004]|uniref:tyrosinase MelC2 n=1 Tax=Krasilnikovia sp. MM14-A1004 TaxID=3373541 RepID=UPI00399D2BDB
MGVRKNQAKLTTDEKGYFVNAVLELKKRGRYDEFVRTHNKFILGDTDNGKRTGHRSPSFLPWHRQFLLDFERALQAIDPRVNLPYWDWTDRDASKTPFTKDFLGGDGRSSDNQVTDGPFAFSGGKWTISVSGDSRKFLRRELGASQQPLPSASDVRSVLGQNTYDVSPWNSTSSSGFRNLIEGWRGPNLHNRVHVWVGGDMTSGTSPNDPVFWLHHCHIDKLWADWQKAHPSSSYLPTQATTNVVALNGTMEPWGNVTPADMLDHTKWYTYE